MSRPTATDVAPIVLSDHAEVVPIPTLVRGELTHPRPVSMDELHAGVRSPSPSTPAASGGALRFRIDDLQVIREPALDAAGFVLPDRFRFLVIPRPDPRKLIERDAGELARTLYALPFGAVLDYVGALRDELAAARDRLAAAEPGLAPGAPAGDRLLRLGLELLPALFDPHALADAVDRELEVEGRPGRRMLDGWVEVPATATRGVMSRMAERVFGGGVGAALTPCLRAIPTRQLHITAGNSPLIPAISLLRAIATKGASVVKTATEASGVMAALATAMAAADPRHPITRHTSLVYWPGGDHEIEEPLFAPGAFDRVVVWGGADTVRSVRRRAGLTKTISFNPRYGLSLVGREAFEGRLDEAAQRASIDTMVWDQKACTASLVHYVEGDEARILDYCKALQRALARWDEHLPRTLSRAALGRLRLLRRGELIGGTWFENGTPPQVGSAVVYVKGPFDLSVHPMSRLVVVRRLDRLEDVLPFVSDAAAAAGVFPDEALARLRDPLAAAGVSNVFPLGECEQAYPGIPHDGMRVLSELVNWASSAAVPATSEGGQE